MHKETQRTWRGESNEHLSAEGGIKVPYKDPTSFVSSALQKQPLNYSRQQQATHLLDQWRIRAYLFSFFSYAIGFALEMKK